MLGTMTWGQFVDIESSEKVGKATTVKAKPQHIPEPIKFNYNFDYFASRYMDNKVNHGSFPKISLSKSKESQES